MVSLDQQASIENAIRESPKAHALMMFMRSQAITVPSSETDSPYYASLKALEGDNKTAFIKLYEELTQRKVLSEQPIIYDNYFLFVMIVGAKRYSLSQDWIRSVLKLRNTLNEPEKSVTVSFNAVLENNYLTTDGFSSIVLATLILCDNTSIDSKLVRNSIEANRRMQPFIERDFFLALIYQVTTDYAIQVSVSEDSIRVKQFEQTFLQRVKILQNILYAIVVLGIIAGWLYLTRKYPAIKEFANDVGIALQILGISLLAFALNGIRFAFAKLIKMFFGHKSAPDNS